MRPSAGGGAFLPELGDTVVDSRLAWYIPTLRRMRHMERLSWSHACAEIEAKAVSLRRRGLDLQHLRSVAGRGSTEAERSHGCAACMTRCHAEGVSALNNLEDEEHASAAVAEDCARLSRVKQLLATILADVFHVNRNSAHQLSLTTPDHKGSIGRNGRATSAITAITAIAHDPDSCLEYGPNRFTSRC